MAKILLTGASGFLGWNLCRALRPAHALWGTYCGNRVDIEGCRVERLDLARLRDIETLVGRVSPEFIIHAAALVDVDLCEREKRRARLINEEATRVVAECAAKAGARMIYFSTDMVFDGRRGMYRESDGPHPINHYGETKLAGEKWATRLCPGAVVFRLALMYGNGPEAHGSFLGWMLRALRRGEPLGLFTDQFRTPTYVGDVCLAVGRALEREEVAGLYHIAGPERLNRYEFGERVAEEFGFPRSLLRPVLMEDVKGLMPRPRDNSLDNSRASRELGIAFRGVREGLRAVRRESE